MFELCIKDHISSAHFLPGYEGMCKDLHGHTWKIDVYIIGEKLDNVGLLADFAVLKKKLKGTLAPIDHVCLNDLPYFKKVNPSTENIARYVHEHFSKAVHPLRLSKVQVWESDSASVVYYE